MTRATTSTSRAAAIAELGPEQAGLRTALPDYLTLPVAAGYRAELIEGVIEVSPSADPPEQLLALALYRLLHEHRRPDGRPTFAAVLTDPRVFVSEADETVPQPDVAAYDEFPAETPESYRGLQPCLVIEVVTRGSVDKDYRRNRDLYGRAPRVLEYWIVDPRADRRRPSLVVHHRPRGDQPFERIDIPAGGIYESALWPGLRLDFSHLRRE